MIIVTKKNIIFYFSYTACGIKLKTRIVGGQFSKKGDWPWLAALIRPVDCGAALISNHHILTAAHCIQP